MSKLLKSVVAFAIAIGFTSSAGAHDPPGVIFEMWQWPTSQLPVLDADLSEWDVVPEELWITEQDLNNLLITQIDVTDTEPDASDLAVRFTFGWNDETERIYLAYDRFDLEPPARRYRTGRRCRSFGRTLLEFGRAER